MLNIVCPFARLAVCGGSAEAVTIAGSVTNQNPARPAMATAAATTATWLSRFFMPAGAGGRRRAGL